MQYTSAIFLPRSKIFFQIKITSGIFFLEKRLLTTKCVFWFPLQLLSETFIILRRNEGDMIRNVYWYSYTDPLFLSDFNETWIFSIDFRQILKYQISWKSFQWKQNFPCRPSNRRTDMTTLIVAFRNFATHAWKAKLKLLKVNTSIWFNKT